MAKLLFRLRGVPDDEASEVRELLEANGIEYYETMAGNWGISMPGLWLRDESELLRARALLDDYQEQRARQARADWEEDLRTGRQPGQWQMICQQPLKAALYLAAASVILFISIAVFFSF